MRSAVILAGGFGTRFGEGEKALARIAGSPMIRRVAERIVDAVDEIVVNARDEQVPSLERALDDIDAPLRFAVDDVTDQGPLAGMLTGLEAADGSYSLVIACDMPFVVPEFVDVLFSEAVDETAVIPVESSGAESHLQPLQAVYRTEPMATAAANALESGIESPRDAIEGISYVSIDPSQLTTLENGRTLWNVNTVSDLREARRALPESANPSEDASR